MGELGGADEGGDAEGVFGAVGEASLGEDVAAALGLAQRLQTLLGGRKLQVGRRVVVLLALNLSHRNRGVSSVVARESLSKLPG